MYRLIVYIMMKCKNKWIWNMYKWIFYFYFHLLPLDKWDLCKTGTLNVHSWAIKVIVNRRFWINYIMMQNQKKQKNIPWVCTCIYILYLTIVKQFFTFLTCGICSDDVISCYSFYITNLSHLFWWCHFLLQFIHY